MSIDDQAAMGDRGLIEATASFVKDRLEGEGGAHDWWHTWRVWSMARRLCDQEPSADRTVVELGALLHDIADWKFTGGDRSRGVSEATSWLESRGAEPELVAHVADIVGSISYLGAGVPTPMETLEGRIVQDADRLDALGAIGVARAFAYGGHVGEPIHDPGTPVVMHETADAYRGHRGTTLNHFHEKLLLLKDRMHIPAARRLAEERHRFLEQFVFQFQREWDGEA